MGLICCALWAGVCLLVLLVPRSTPPLPWPSAAVIRTASYDRFVAGYLPSGRNLQHDFSTGFEFVVELRLRLVTVFPRYIYMLESPNVLSQLRYQTTYRESMIRMTMRYLLSYQDNECGGGALVFDIGANDVGFIWCRTYTDVFH